ncbi:DUF1684 domain-containing protein [Jatrophihabitans telluris]|uniref:DUF1684 domain-containing protein n=1 Tax=Jatrophihabitans telluris TaxID=2038343 RepID=A0ABY4QYE2_9ACTN|nr:DUF1684 domain-containing protein [Jatrophihabitans telluris]UQX88594.1 DUF1684 domain-containing protein [Jatrophihabitans telluris]
MTDSQTYSLQVADWRRRTHALYAGVRATAAADGPAAAHAEWVTGRTELFERHPASPRTGAQRLIHADYDPAWRFQLPVLEADEQRLDVPTGSDGVVPFDRIGRVHLPVGESDGLDVWWLGSYGGGVFIPFRDATAGSTTYGAGRYLIDTVKGADLGRSADGAEWVLDFNFAYHPSCVYDYRWACPLAPAGNRVSAAIEVGELLPEGYGHQG